MKPELLIQLTRRSGKATRRALGRCQSAAKGKANTQRRKAA